MTDNIYDALSWFANYTNFYSILSVLFCFVVMVVFILRLNGDNFMSSSATHYVTVKEQCMTKIFNPFSVQLDTHKCSSLKDGLHLKFSMKETSKIRILWGVDIQAFQTELQKSSDEITDHFDSELLFDGKYKHSISVELRSVEEGKRSIHVECPGEITEEILGEPPRVVYPVVVVTCLCKTESCESSKVVVQFTVIHLKDSYCTLDSHIVYQFVKTNHNNIISLQPIFMSAGESTTQHDVSNHTLQNNSSHQTESFTQHASTSQGRETQGHLGQSQGHLLKKSDNGFSHCKNCGRIQKCSDGVPATREHEICSCVDSDLDNGQDNLHANGNIETKLNHIENVSREFDISSSIEKDENIEDDSSRKQDTENSHSDPDDSDACCVCQSLPVFYAVLPCRHACVCHRCISLLDKCPICRSLIESYFRITERRSSTELQSSNDENENVGLNRWQVFNQRLNEMLGFI